ncbi:uncharacterized protein LOC116924622 [Daphnia magna]|uniref:uncharacterized protein LOC116924622 n=1 Tax=Daphnia magna TaxID=35525 RepID=UPI001E1BC7EF|nr:uncharacterized protein LOC116924622 [Daphnia magna]
MAIVPKIITLAKSSSSASVIKVLRYYASLKNFETCFDKKCCAALELLCLLTTVSKRSAESRRCIIDIQEDCADMRSYIRKLPASRLTPFLLKISECYTIVVDKEALTQSSNSCMEAIVLLLSVYYVFHIGWCKATILTLLFMQTEMLKLSLDDEDIHYGSVSIFTNALDAIHEEQE